MSRPKRITPTHTNGPVPSVPPDIVWDEDNPPMLFACSNHVFHLPECSGNCNTMRVTEMRVKLINEGLAYARAGMNWHGVPAAYAEAIPVPGIRVELTDVLMWLELLRDLVCELAGLSIDEFDDMFTQRKFEMLHSIRERSEAHVKKQRTKNMLGIVDKPIFGPDGRPL